MKATAFIICCLLIGAASAFATMEIPGMTVALSLMSALWAIDSLMEAICGAVSKLDRVLDERAEKDCSPNCKCVFCREYERGVKSGREDALHAVSTIVDRGEA